MNRTLLSIAMLVCCSAAARAAVDQSFVPGTIGISQFDQQPFAQTFRVGTAGHLSGVDLYLSQLNPDANLIVQIWDADGGTLPTNNPTVLTSATVPLSQVPSSSPGGAGPDLVHVQFAGNLPAVQVGDDLAIVLRRDQPASALGSGQYGIVWVYGNGYASGAAMHFAPAGYVGSIPELPPGPGYLPDRWESSADRDFSFRTYVDANTAVNPEPTALWLLISAAGVMTIRRPRGRRGDVQTRKERLRSPM